jgi:limonene-1,2-epoxide hydrolase
MKTCATLLISLGLILNACQKPTPVQDEPINDSSSTDINIGKKVIKAYLEGDWDTFKKTYAKAARIWRNENWNKTEGFSVDEYIADLQQGLESMSSYTFDTQTWQRIVNEEGEHWVLFWGIWQGHSQITNKDYDVAVHMVMLVDDGKILLQGEFFDNTEITLDMMNPEQNAG